MKTAQSLLVLYLMCLALGGCNVDTYEEAIKASEKGDYSTARKLLLPLAEKGDVRAQCSLGRMYFVAAGVKQDFKESAYWYRKAAELGNASAQYDLGFLLFYPSTGVPQNFKQASYWFRKAADQGYADAQRELGMMYTYGHGVPQDYKEAAKWFLKSADQGNSDAQIYIGDMYLNGKGVPQDFKEAANWYRKNAQNGRFDGLEKLGHLYAKGQGVDQDIVLAHAFFVLSDVESTSVIEEKLSSVQIEEAKALIATLEVAGYSGKILSPLPMQSRTGRTHISN
jgi:hypothetical protein